MRGNQKAVEKKCRGRRSCTVADAAGGGSDAGRIRHDSSVYNQLRNISAGCGQFNFGSEWSHSAGATHAKTSIIRQLGSLQPVRRICMGGRICAIVFHSVALAHLHANSCDVISIQLGQFYHNGHTGTECVLNALQQTCQRNRFNKIVAKRKGYAAGSLFG